MPTPLRIVTKVIAAVSLTLSMLIGVAPTASAAVPTNATISETRWLVSTSKGVTLAWSNPSTVSSAMVRSPWPWGASWSASETVSVAVATGTNVSRTITCTDSTSNLSVVFTIEVATVTGNVNCRFTNTGNTSSSDTRNGSQDKRVWIENNISIAAGSRVTVEFASGLVTAHQTPRRDSWIVGEYTASWDATKQVELYAEAYAPQKVGFDPATDTAPTGPVTLVISKDLKEATCTAPAYTIPPDRYNFYFSSQGTQVGNGIQVFAPTNSVTIPIPASVVGYKLGCAVNAFALNSMFGSGTEAQVGEPLQPEGPPLAPATIRATGLAGAILVQWDAAVVNGPYSISNYLAQSTPESRVCITRRQDPSLTNCIFTNLKPGTAYTFKAQGLTGLGWGKTSAASNSASPFTIRITKTERKKILLGLQQQVSFTGEAPGLPAGTKIDGEVKIGNGNWKRVSLTVSGSGGFNYTLKLKGGDRKAAVSFKASYTNPGLANDSLTAKYASVQTKTFTAEGLR